MPDAIEKAIALLKDRGFKVAPPLKVGTLFFQDERGSATIDPAMGSVEIAEPVDGLEALLSPSPSIEEIRKALRTLLDRIVAPRFLENAHGWRDLFMEDFDRELARLQRQHTQTTPSGVPQEKDGGDK